MVRAGSARSTSVTEWRDPGVPSSFEDTKSGPPRICLSTYGKIVAENLERMNTLYAHIRIDRSVIMPNHVHLLIREREENISEIMKRGSAEPTPIPGNWGSG